jgi:hypothetical protein
MLKTARGGGVVVTSGAEPQAVLDELSHEIERLNKENAALRQRIQLLTHRLFGRRSEKGVPVITPHRPARSEAAVHRTAILCSLVQTCKHLPINPFVYLRDVIDRVSTYSARLVLELTPREWKRLRQDSGTQVAA